MNTSCFYQKIDSYFENKDFAGAENFMKDILSKAEAEQDHGAIITVCNELGGFYRAFSRYHQGIPLYEEALKSLQKLNMEGSEAYGTTLLNFATTLAIVHRNQEALEAYRKAEIIFSGRGFVQDYRLATLHNNMSSLYQTMGQLTEAAAHLQKAMSILKGLSQSEIDMAVTWTNLAGVYLSMGMDALEDARDAAQKALDLFHSVSGDTDVHFAAAVSALGEVCYLEGKFPEAEDLFRTAMELTKRDYGSQTLSYALLCENLAAVLQAQDRQNEAAEYKKTAIEIKERIAQ